MSHISAKTTKGQNHSPQDPRQAMGNNRHELIYA